MRMNVYPSLDYMYEHEYWPGTLTYIEDTDKTLYPEHPYLVEYERPKGGTKSGNPGDDNYKKVDALYGDTVWLQVVSDFGVIMAFSAWTMEIYFETDWHGGNNPYSFSEGPNRGGKDIDSITLTIGNLENQGFAFSLEPYNNESEPCGNGIYREAMLHVDFIEPYSQEVKYVQRFKYRQFTNGVQDK